MTLARSMASWSVNFSIAMVALRTNLMRSILTTLGVMIGVLSVILAVAVGDGAKVSVMESINALGSNMAIVLPQPESRGGRRSTDRGRLTERDARAVVRQVEGVSAVAPQLRSMVQLVVAGRNATTNAFGVTADYAQVANVDVDAGRFISDVDVRAAARVIVLGPSVAAKLFGSFDPVGQTVRVARVPFTVVGILATKGSSFGNDNDDLALVPLTAARQRFASAASQGPDDLTVLFVGFDDGVDLASAKKDMVRVLRARNNVAKGEISPFTVNTTEEFLKQSSTVTGVFQAVLVAIASISLLVGGIGIMNIMLVSVTERTREIGLRMALGATRRDIRNQFLVEAAVLCVIGGTMGLALAIGAATLFERFAGFPAPIGVGTAVGSVLFSAAIGLLFGGWPAVRASRLSPIEALRSE
ncbi:MAG: ABC transporter permease [Sphingomonas bacterium]|nr:ABC transporter permease [Sphingomonas bacterium]